MTTVDIYLTCSGGISLS